MGSLFRRKPRPEDFDQEPVDHYNRDESFREGTRLMERGDWQGAENFFRDILTRDPNDVQTLKALAHVLGKKGFRRDAILICNKLLMIDPNDAEAKASLKELMASG